LQNIKKIECPSCGAAGAFKLNATQYKCNYCQTEFEFQSSNTTIENTTRVNDSFTGKPKQNTTFIRSCALIGGVIFSFAIGCITYFTTLSSRTNTDNATSYANLVSNTWQEPSISNSFVFLGAKGAVIVNILKQQTKTLDSAKILAEVIDPKEKKSLTTNVLTSGNWKDITFNNSSLFSTFYTFNDIAYTIDKENGLTGFNIYSFEQVLFANTLTSKFKELNSGISKAEKDYALNAFKLTTNQAEEYYYFPENSKLLSEKEKQSFERQKRSPVTSIFFMEGKRPYLLSLTKKDGFFNDNAIINIDDTLKIKEEKSWLYNAFGLSNIKLISKKVYFKLQVLGRYKQGLVFAYTESLAPKAKVILSYVNNEGVLQWENTNESLKSLITSNSDFTINCESKMNTDELVISTYTYPKQFICFNLANGQQKWLYENKK
jgi:hypothetical protein